MTPLTLQLPETLREQLAQLAESEGISLDQYIVYTLTRQVSSAYSVQVIPQVEVEQQETAFQNWTQSSEQCSDAEAAEILAEREPVESGSQLSPELITRFQKMIHNQQ